MRLRFIRLSAKPYTTAKLALVMLLVCGGLGFSESGNAQTKAVKDAAELAEELQYADAVRMLELALIEGDTSEQLRFDLATYYKKTGDLRRATSLCKPLVDKPRPRPWHLLEVSTMLIDQGRIRDAEPYLARFEEMKPEDPRAEALRERARSRRTIVAMYPGARLDTFMYNTRADDGFPFVRTDTAGVETLLWSSDRAGGRSVSGWTGRSMFGIYNMRMDAAEAREPGTKLAEPNRLDGRFNRGILNAASPWLSGSGDTLLFTSNADHANRFGDLNMQLYFATRKRGSEAGDGELGEWRSATHIPSQNDQASCLHPTLSADGRWLYYASDAPDSRGGLDLYRMAVQANGSWGRPQNLGAGINTERHDAFPVAAADGKLYFASQGHVGLGGFDVFVSEEQRDGSWSEPRNLGEPINSESDETGWLPVRSGRGYLVSDRTGGDDDIYVVEW